MWGLLAPTPPGRARKPCTGVWSWYAGLLRQFRMCQNSEKSVAFSGGRFFTLLSRFPPAGALTSPAPPCVGLPPAHSAHTEQRRKAFISRASGAPNQLPWSPSGDTHSSPLRTHRTTPQGVHKPRKRRTSPLPWSPSGDTHSSPACSHRTTPQGVHKPRKRRTPPTTLVAVRRHTLQPTPPAPKNISRASGAPHQLPWSPSGDTNSSPAYRR